MKNQKEHFDAYPDVVDFAYQIISIHHENEQLRNELDHYKKMHKSSCESMNKSHEHTKKMTAIILSAAIDPDSVINKGHATIIKESLEKK